MNKEEKVDLYIKFEDNSDYHLYKKIDGEPIDVTEYYGIYKKLTGLDISSEIYNGDVIYKEAYEAAISALSFIAETYLDKNDFISALYQGKSFIKKFEELLAKKEAKYERKTNQLQKYCIADTKKIREHGNFKIKEIEKKYIDYIRFFIINKTNVNRGIFANCDIFVGQNIIGETELYSSINDGSKGKGDILYPSLINKKEFKKVNYPFTMIFDMEKKYKLSPSSVLY